MKKIVSIILLAICALFAIVYGKDAYEAYQTRKAFEFEEQQKQAAIESVLTLRKIQQEGEEIDPFGDDDILRVLFIGLDSRAGEEHGHCDAIQFIELDRKQQTVSITAVPRGTYSPLPPGTGTTSSDYYVSNSCALGGLDYGIQNIERIVRKEADYVVLVGFSETLGILRQVKLPTIETLQWLRNRQGYAIGEPQRARNHSTFIKQMFVKFIPDSISVIDKTFHYVLYSKLQTDLSFAQAKMIVEELVNMDIANNPDRIQLLMKPAYDVQDIAYNPTEVNEHLENTVGKVSRLLSPKDYSGESIDDIQQKLLVEMEQSKKDPEFIIWAFENDLWLQIEDKETRNQFRWEFLLEYIETLPSKQQQDLLADYILEMQHIGEEDLQKQAEQELLKRVQY